MAARAGGNQQGSEFIAVQRDGMRLIVQPRPPDIGSRRVLQELSSTAYR
jgi:hypothetical protein